MAAEGDVLELAGLEIFEEEGCGGLALRCEDGLAIDELDGHGQGFAHACRLWLCGGCGGVWLALEQRMGGGERRWGGRRGAMRAL